MKGKLSIFLILAVLSLTACSMQSAIDEKMGVLKGDYLPINNYTPWVDGNPYAARIEKVGDRWVFSFVIPIYTYDHEVLHHFEQGVTWSPELGEYLFEQLSDANLKLLGVEKVETRYSRELITMNGLVTSNAFEGTMSVKITNRWSKLP